MKYLILITSLFLTSYTLVSTTPEVYIDSIPIKTIELVEESPELKIEVVDYTNLESLINAIIMVESSGNDSAYCKKEKAVGCLQIRPIMLAECNRILKIQNSPHRYLPSDRWDRDKSITIFKIVSNYHNKYSTYESIARFWNGGPKWSKKKQTKLYWNKVKRNLKV